MKPTRMLRYQSYHICDLDLVATAETYRGRSAPPFAIGDRVRLNSGSPPLLVVDFNGNYLITVAMRKKGGVEEYSFPEICLHLI